MSKKRIAVITSVKIIEIQFMRFIDFFCKKTAGANVSPTCICKEPGLLFIRGIDLDPGSYSDILHHTSFTLRLIMPGVYCPVWL